MIGASIQFHTNIDCCKRFMGYVSGLPPETVNPLVGDLVELYSDSEFQLNLKVVSRRWSQAKLYIELHLTDYWASLGLPAFIKMMRENNFS